jgi:hypothetical protein
MEEFAAVAKDPVKLGVLDFWFKRTDGKTPAYVDRGFLFPPPTSSTRVSWPRRSCAAW